MADTLRINGFLQAELGRRGLSEITAVGAAGWLDAAGLLKDSKDKRGRELRRLLRAKRITGARHDLNHRWFIERLPKN